MAAVTLDDVAGGEVVGAGLAGGLNPCFDAGFYWCWLGRWCCVHGGFCIGGQRCVCICAYIYTGRGRAHMKRAPLLLHRMGAGQVVVGNEGLGLLLGEKERFAGAYALKGLGLLGACGPRRGCRGIACGAWFLRSLRLCLLGLIGLRAIGVSLGLVGLKIGGFSGIICRWH